MQDEWDEEAQEGKPQLNDGDRPAAIAERDEIIASLEQRAGDVVKIAVMAAPACAGAGLKELNESDRIKPGVLRV